MLGWGAVDAAESSTLLLLARGRFESVSIVKEKGKVQHFEW